MKTATALALVAAVSGAVIEPRETPATEFDVTDFSASCQPHSVLCFFSFTVTAATTGATTTCSATVQGPDVLPAVGLRACDDPRFSWAFELATDGAGHGLTIDWEWTPGSNQTGTHLIPAADVVRENHGSVTTERYVGPASFVISPLQKQ